MKLLTIGIVLMLCACGIADPTDVDDNSPINTPPVTTRDPLAPVAFNDDIIDPQSRFASYSEQAQRISIIDPVAKKEVWGKQVGIYEYAVPHPGFTGATLFKRKELLMLSQESAKSISLKNHFSHMAIGSSQVAYAFANNTGDKIEIIRSLGFGNWQHEEFELPWGMDGSIENPFETDVSLPLASLFMDDDQKLLVFNPADGKYLWFTAETSNSLLQMENNFCEGNGNLESANVFRYVVYDKSLSLLIAGDYQGQLSLIELGNSCHDYNITKTIMLPESAPVLYMKAAISGELLVSQGNGQLNKLNYAKSGFSSEVENFPGVCTYPAGFLPMRDRFLLIACLPLVKTAPDIDERFYQLYDSNEKMLINEWSPDTHFSGIGIDRQQLILHRMLESSLGVLQSINLETGEVNEKSGLFLQGILD